MLLKNTYRSLPNFLKISKTFHSYGILLCLTWVAFFFYIRDFGLYEDDYYAVGIPMGYRLSHLLTRLLDHLTLRFPNARPLGYMIKETSAYIGFTVGGLQGVYIIGYLFVALNICLFYKLIKIRFPERLAFFAALAFCLFPADTTKTLLIHSLVLQPSLTFLLIASLLYLRGKKNVSYVVILGSLLTYESGLLPFLAIPLFEKKWDKHLLFSIIKHFVILSFLITCWTIIRKYVVGEYRVNNLIGISMLPKVLFSFIIGPAVSLTSFAYGPLMAFKALLHHNHAVSLVVIGLFIMFVYVFYRSTYPNISEMVNVSFHMQVQEVSVPLSLPKKIFSTGFVLLTGFLIVFCLYIASFKHFEGITSNPYGKGPSVHLGATFGFALVWGMLCYLLLLIFYSVIFRGSFSSVAEFGYIRFQFQFHQFLATLNVSEEIVSSCRAFFIGVITLFLAYSLAFTHFPPIARYGRGTSVHLAATFGCALICGVFSYLSHILFRSKHQMLVGSAVMALYFALLVGYGIVIQQDFRQSWDNQRWFWQSVIRECPDLSEGTMIFVEKKGLPVTKYIKTHSWADPLILEQIFQFPKNWDSVPESREWETVPRLWVVDTNWTSKIIVKNGRFQWKVPNATWWSYWADLPPHNVIVLKIVNGSLTRIEQPLQLQGETFPLKKKVISEEISQKLSFEKGQLFKYLIDEPPASPIGVR